MQNLSIEKKEKRISYYRKTSDNDFFKKKKYDIRKKKSFHSIKKTSGEDLLKKKNCMTEEH